MGTSRIVSELLVGSYSADRQLMERADSCGIQRRGYGWKSNSCKIKPMNIGDDVPTFETRASLNGEAFDYSLSEALENGMVVVYFYPSAFTPGCNIQAHEFADNMEAFNDAGATVIGVSLDSIDRLNEYSADSAYCAGKLAVASDATGEIAKSYDLMIHECREGAADTRGVTIEHGFAERKTFIVSADGKIVETISGVSPTENVLKALEVVQRRE